MISRTEQGQVGRLFAQKPCNRDTKAPAVLLVLDNNSEYNWQIRENWKHEAHYIKIPKQFTHIFQASIAATSSMVDPS